MIVRRPLYGAAMLLATLLGACDQPAAPQRPTVDPTVVVERLDVAMPLEAVSAGQGHAAFPHAVRLADGDVLVSWRQGAAHMYPPARIMLARYRLEADSLRLVETTELLDTPEDEREAGLVQLRDGTVLANAFLGTYTSYTPEGEAWRLAVLRSSDGGRTWQDTVQIDPASLRTRAGRSFYWLATRGAVVEAPDGGLLMPVYGLARGDRRHSNHLLRSTDGGRSWQYWSQIARDPRQSADYNETSLLVSGNRVTAAFRSEDGYLRESVSLDGGRTFPQPRKLELWGVPPHLLRLVDGRVLLTRGYRREGMGVRYALSTNGSEWLPEVEGVLESGSETEDCGYPSTVQLGDGSLFTVYYASHRTPVELTTGIRGVRYRIPADPTP